MTKDEALRMALRWFTDVSTNNEVEVINAIEEALAQPTTEQSSVIQWTLIAEPTDGIELEWYCKGWDDAEKDLATQEPVD